MSGLMRPVGSILITVVVVVLFTGCGRDEAPPGETLPPVTLGPARPPVVFATGPSAGMQTLLDAYTAETGVEVELIVDEMAAAPPPADLYVLRGIAELWRIAESGQLRPTLSATVNANVPELLRDPEARWAALSLHSLLVAYNSDLVAESALENVQDYAALGEPHWRGKLCLSSSTLPSNLALVAYLIDRHGEREGELVVRNWRANFAGNVLGNETELLDALSSGQCAIVITRSNSIATFVAQHASATLAVHRFADSQSYMVDASGAGVSRHAENPEAANALLEWLTTNAPNALFASLDHEFPVNSESPAASNVAAQQVTVATPSDLPRIGFLLEDARRLVERARYP